MKEEKTQGINKETTTKNTLKPAKNKSNTELIDLKAGATSPYQEI